MPATNISGTITAGGTAQVLSAADTINSGFWVMNLSSSDLWINEIGGTASAEQPSIKLKSGDMYESVPPIVGDTFYSYSRPYPLAISIFGATTGQAFAARRW